MRPAKSDRPAAAGLRDLWGNRDFIRFWAGSFTSTLGSQLSSVAFPLLALALGASATEAGLLATCGLVSRLMMRLHGGQLADRLDRKAVMLWTTLARLFAIGSIPVAAGLGHISYLQLVVATVIEGIGSALYGPAASIAVQDILAKDQIRVALSRTQASYSAAGLMGPIIGGWLYTIDRILPFTLDAASYLVSGAVMLTLSFRKPDRSGPAGDNRLTAGVHWLRRQPNLLRVLLFCCLLNLASAACEIGVVVTLRTEGERASVIGMVLGCAGVGSVFGAIFATRVIASMRLGMLFMVVGGTWALGLASYALSPPPLIIGAVFALMIFVTPTTGIVMAEAMLNHAPRELLGRILSASNLGVATLGSAGPFVAGAGIQLVGSRATWTALAAIAAIATLAASRPLWRVTQLVDTPVPDASAAEAFGGSAPAVVKVLVDAPPAEPVLDAATVVLAE